MSTILQSLRADLKIDDARQSPRVGLRARTIIQPYTSDRAPIGPPAEAWVRDVSTNGIGLTHNRPLAPGQWFDLKLPDGAGGVISIACTIVHCEPISPEQYRIGAKFIGEPLAKLAPEPERLSAAQRKRRAASRSAT